MFHPTIVRYVSLTSSPKTWVSPYPFCLACKVCCAFASQPTTRRRCRVFPRARRPVLLVAFSCTIDVVHEAHVVDFGITRSQRQHGKFAGRSNYIRHGRLPGVQHCKRSLLEAMSWASVSVTPVCLPSSMQLLHNTHKASG